MATTSQTHANRNGTAGSGVAAFAKRRLRDPGRRLIARNLWKKRRIFSLTVALTVVGAALEAAGITLLIPFLSNLLNPDAEPIASGYAWIDHWILAVDAPRVERLYRISAIILGSVWLRVGASYLSKYYSVRLTESVLHRLRRQAVDQLQAVALSFFSDTRSGTIINTLTTEMQRLRMLFSIANTTFSNSFMLVTYGAAIIFMSWQLSLVALLFCLVLFFMLSGFLKKLRDNGQAIARTNGRIASTITEIIGGIRTIMEFGTQRYEAGKFKEVSAESRDVIVQATTRSGLVGPLTQGVASTALIVMVIFAVQFLILRGLMSTATLLAFMVVLLRLLPILRQVNDARAQWSIYRGSLDDVAELLQDKGKPYLPDGRRPLSSFDEGITVDHVSFGYEPGQRVLKDLSLTFPHGTTTAIVGASGAGKSTLADLVARLYDPTEGRILLDGTDLREYRLSDLRRVFAVVNQSTHLFNMTARENIAYGLEDVSEARIREVARKANALGFIEEMDKGFDTMMGERGARLSGGQRQRIAIARALLRDPDILILDEATSALDSVSEKAVQESLEYLMQGRTVIVIAHRLSTVENADRVIVLEEGRIAEQGTYQELLDEEGQLWEYHKIQFQLA